MTVCRGGPQHSSFDVWVVMSFKYWVQLFRSRRKYSVIYMCIQNDCQIYWYFRVFLSRVNEQSYCTSVVWRIFPDMLQTREYERKLITLASRREMSLRETHDMRGRWRLMGCVVQGVLNLQSHSRAWMLAQLSIVHLSMKHTINM